MALHPQAKSFLDELAKQNAPSWDELPPTDSREVFSSLTHLFGESPPVEHVADHRVSDQVQVRVYRPQGEGPFPAIVYFHGGGWVLGNLDTHDGLCRRIAVSSQAVVIAVDYRLSPETKFPEPLEDCYAATRFVFEQSEQLQVDPTKILVAGDSAGGNLAAAVSRLARDRKGPPICFQLLLYPVMDHRCETDSFHEFANDHGLTGSVMRWFWQQYLAHSDDGNQSLASPSMANDLTGLPAAHVITAEYDVLRDEGESYAEKLRAAGVPTTCRRYHGMLHGFIHLSSVFDDGRLAMDDIGEIVQGVKGVQGANGVQDVNGVQDEKDVQDVQGSQGVQGANGVVAD